MQEQETNPGIQEKENIENPEENQKTFTQEEVNKIISKRLKGYKELQENAKEVERKGKALACKEYLLDNSYPTDLLDVISYDDVDDFKEKVEKLYKSVEPRQQAPLASSDPSCFDISKGLSREKRKPKDPRFW